MNTIFRPLTPTELRRIQGLTREHGDRPAARLLLVNIGTLTKALAGRPLRPSTSQCLRSRLRELDNQEAR